jgi:hypothetical protein
VATCKAYTARKVEGGGGQSETLKSPHKYCPKMSTFANIVSSPTGYNLIFSELVINAECLLEGLRCMGVWQGVATDSLKFH